MKKQWAMIVLAAVLIADAPPPSIAAQKRGRSAAASLNARARELGSIAQFKEAFQNDLGRVRLVALVSPT